eukprot:15458904-Alexandrium_andersonii.AAC.1
MRAHGCAMLRAGRPRGRAGCIAHICVACCVGNTVAVAACVRALGCSLAHPDVPREVRARVLVRVR